MNNRIDKAVLIGLNAKEWRMKKKLAGGYSQSEVCLIEVNDQQYVIKLDDISQQQSVLNRSYAAHAIAAEKKLAPKIFYANAEEGVVLMEYIENQALPKQSLQLVKEIAAVISQLHAGPEFPEWISPLTIAQYVSAQMPSTLKDKNVIKTALGMLPSFEKMLNDPADMRPCHGDLNPNNILYDGKCFRFADWDSASQKNLYFDLASCATFLFAQHDELANALLQAYCGREPTEVENKKYASMRVFAKLFYGLVIAVTACRDGYQCVMSENEKDELPSFKHLYGKMADGSDDFANAAFRFKLGIALLHDAVSCQLLLKDGLASATTKRM